MENGGGNMFIATYSDGNRNRGQDGNNTINSNNAVCDNNNMWAFTNTLMFTSTTTTTTTAPEAAVTTTHSGTSTPHALMFHPTPQPQPHHHPHQHQLSLYAGDGSHVYPDPHLTCLKLGKRHYFEDNNPISDRHVAGFSLVKKGKPYYYGAAGGGVGASSSSAISGSAAPAVVPRCQVEGCHVALINAKEYHRRHKVCEVHSKAPQVVVLGLEQRFCQQCSRFHAVSEFDDSKRSCRRRLAGHNERRRKGSQDSLPKSYSSQGRALSLLSSNADTWISSSQSDLSSRCSAALRELIAENRATVLARQYLILENRDLHAMEDIGDNGSLNFSSIPHHNQHHHILSESNSWSRYQVSNNGHVTLDLMQAPTAEFGFLSVTSGKDTKENDDHQGEDEVEEGSDLWNSVEGTRVI